VSVRTGKPLNVLALKGTSLQETRAYADFLSTKAAALMRPELPRRVVTSCPCCRADSRDAEPVARVFGMDYARCPGCGHAFVRVQPVPEALTEVFAESEEHSAAYIDRRSLEVRLEQVVRPKLDWVRDTYRRCRGAEVGSVDDVGAGGGHFVAACRRAGLRADGYELSRASRRFAREAFDLDLLDRDFLADADATADVFTFWGLLEYTPEPRAFLDAARARLDGRRGMLVVEVPRFDCLGSAVQAACPDTVARHLDPTSHVNCFSDESLATALLESGFRPVAAWYFGMDAYEVLVQLSLKGDPELFRRAADLIPPLQATLDAGLLCDDLVVAAVPLD
jgi:2-polyprenyl-3-methyl-5-hydroxy-6-metoxy-1,4-benzoquinol methylase